MTTRMGIHPTKTTALSSGFVDRRSVCCAAADGVTFFRNNSNPDFFLFFVLLANGRARPARPPGPQAPEPVSNVDREQEIENETDARGHRCAMVDRPLLSAVTIFGETLGIKTSTW
jgi:hypothetical protein